MKNDLVSISDYRFSKIDYISNKDKKLVETVKAPHLFLSDSIQRRKPSSAPAPQEPVPSVPPIGEADGSPRLRGLQDGILRSSRRSHIRSFPVKVRY
jgi:hypothetical protein